MATVSPALTLHSWQGRRILALLCAVAFLDETHGAELQADPPLAAAAPEPITKEI